ncbi:3'(2'),5'-bisphosphate nucleotidase [Anseongella ginsenosidimutans]|uniref:3'(2'),5'-bisphosphate nucleotidase CysQ n=1 Tax=Anseongella ginsenosidimutans TaxID=496056 RepID=A0A4R3KR26_9SPHI|nr:3'(2'),5'-bisphosphate nucleotidase CysQ [Anseongella ginsenosidimutans]QEC52164.1 3'(2'),5'-bisphosphate nucleotidase CysQ [Anseongella ginsenosidimutans]TCS86705.1 3'(2'),5'-bisphosphate nucleotidase [Anseongella ginsenosidimutans]
MISNISVAIGAALRAGAEILDVYNSEIAVELKEDRTPLTEADRRAHKVISEKLIITGLPVLSEEGRSIPYDVRHPWESFWMVDPLDGTKEFIKRNGEFTVNIALIDKRVPVLGVIYVPVKKILYYGAWNQGSTKLEGIEPAWPGATDKELTAYVKRKLIKGMQVLPLENERKNYAVVASRSHLSAETEVIIEEKRKQYGEVETVSMGSSLKLCLVAEGSADLYPRLAPTMEWDTAAGHAIARYAGCRVYDAKTGLELEYNKVDLLNPWFIVERPVCLS